MEGTKNVVKAMKKVVQGRGEGRGSSVVYTTS